MLNKKTPVNGVKIHSITRRLVFYLVITVIFVSAISIALLYSAFLDDEKKELHEKAEEFQSYLVGILEIPLWDLDINSIRGICETFAQNDLVVRLMIIDDSDATIYSMEKEHGSDLVNRSAKIYHRGDYLGKFEFSLTKRYMAKASRKLLSSHATTMVFILTSLLVVAGVLFRSLLKNPLNDLDDIVRSYAAGNYDARTVELPYREFRPFGNVLSQMGEKINEQIKGLQEAEQKYRSIFENAVEGIFQSTPGAKGRFIRANPAHARILGYNSPEQMLAQVNHVGGDIWVNPQDRVNFSEQVVKGPVTNFETQFRHRDGQILWVSLNARPTFNESGELDFIEGIMLDITERKRAEDELKKHRGQLETQVKARTIELAAAKELAEAAKITAEEANQAKSDFLARMSHEIRTPLNAVAGLTNIVLKSELSEEQRDYLNKVQIASNNLLAVINDILDFSKVEVGRLDLEHHPFDLGQLMEQLADLFSDRVAQKDLELIFAIDPDVPRHLIGDDARLIQILTNLVSNAVKFTDTGEIVVEVGQGGQGVKRTGQTILQFLVRDTGIGISADVLPALFDPFIQADSSLTRKHEGTGLGLAICKRLVELMGGRVWAESTPGRGSIFTFNVVFEVQKEKKPRVSLPMDLYGLKVLVVDDSDTASQVLVGLLESFNFDVAAVDSGEKAVEVIGQAASREPFQLVLLDWQMSGIDGIETAKRIRKIDTKVNKNSYESLATSHKPIPIIILVTAYGLKMINDRIDTSVVDTALPKPVKPSQLFNKIMELFGRKKTAVPIIKEKKAAGLGPLEGRRVLVVEDSELNLDVAMALLEETGMIVEAAENGRIAVEKVHGSGQGYYDAVLMDIQMPEMDGYEATHRIRQWEADSQFTNHRLPIVALTAHALKGEEDKCLAADMDDYLSKPIDEKELRRVLIKWIGS